MARVLARLVANQACIALSVKVLCRSDLAAGKRAAKMAKSHDLLVASLRIVLHLSQTRSESVVGVEKLPFPLKEAELGG